MAVGPTAVRTFPSHVMQVDPRSAQTRAIIASCEASGCMWSIRGALDLDAAQLAFTRAHTDGWELKVTPAARSIWHPKQLTRRESA
jgi:hypothetical protein